MPTATEQDTETLGILSTEQYVNLVGGPSTDALITALKEAYNINAEDPRDRTVDFMSAEGTMFTVQIIALGHESGDNHSWMFTGNLVYYIGEELQDNTSRRVHGGWNFLTGHGTIRLGEPPS